MVENTILIITEEKYKIATNISNKEMKIDIWETGINQTIVDKLNTEIYEQYKYIVFTEECKLYAKIHHYVPLNFIPNCKNKIFIQEIFLNPIIIENIGILVDKKYIIEIAIILKHIIKSNGNKEMFNFDKEAEDIRKINNYNMNDILRLKNDIYNSVARHYCQNSKIRLIKFKMNKDDIVKEFLFKVYKNVLQDIKRNTDFELLVKELFEIIHN